jgi:AAA+ ATPase superfamily predicted ATPase/predicted RNA-binding Zn-ribbon protein involved in translation (DUF1610 family)
MKNPFPCGTIALRENFVGRNEEISLLLRTIRLGENATIVGPNGIGKSSLLAELARRNSNEFVFVPIDLSGITDETALLDVMTRETMKAAYGEVESFPPNAWEVLVNPKLRTSVIEGMKYASVKKFGTRFVEFSAKKMVDRGAEEKPSRRRAEIRMCQKCGAPLKWVEKYSRHYCYRCKKYASLKRTIKLPLGKTMTLPPDELVCPRCRNDLEFVHKYSEYYCSKCKKYPMLEIRRGSHVSLTQSDIDEALDLPERIAIQNVTRVVVMLDEFQEVDTLEDPGILPTLRQRFEMHGNVSYIFAGSNRETMKRIFLDKDAPFEGFVQWIDLEPMSESVLEKFVMDRFESAKGRISKETAELVVGVSGGFPDYALKVAHELYSISPAPSLQHADEAIDIAVRRRSPMYSVLWESIRSPLHRNYLIAIANEPKVAHGEDFVKRHRLKSRSHVQRTERQLAGRGIIRDNEIVDPMFVLWLRATTYS